MNFSALLPLHTTSCRKTPNHAVRGCRSYCHIVKSKVSNLCANLLLPWARQLHIAMSASQNDYSCRLLTMEYGRWSDQSRWSALPAGYHNAYHIQAGKHGKHSHRPQ
jgi:hypothetical protein